MRAVRGRRVAMIFQEPATALNPVLTVGRQIMEVIERHTALAGDAARRRALELLDAVGIPDAARRCDEYPFQLSGGLKQRVMIAAALAAEPEVLIADEPTTALDVTIQAQILDLLAKLQAERAHGDSAHHARPGHRRAHGAARGGDVRGRDRGRSRGATNSLPRPSIRTRSKLFQALPSPRKRGADLAVIARPGAAADRQVCRLPLRRALRVRLRALPPRGAQADSLPGDGPARSVRTTADGALPPARAGRGPAARRCAGRWRGGKSRWWRSNPSRCSSRSRT